LKTNYLTGDVHAEKLLVQMDPGLYFFINQGCLTVDNMNDKEEMDIVDVRAILLFAVYRHGAEIMSHYSFDSASTDSDNFRQKYH